ncbi:Hypothetical protein I5071_85200 [Sandaracinus amylolyticus]|nr:Hypothetical protein I5071_85200 [Sandaracinus amylolyticus]
MASAQDRPRVAIAIDPSCTELDAELTAHVLAIELGDDAELAPSDLESTTRARVSCEGTSVSVDVDDGLTRKRLQRTFDLASAPAAVRARLVALAIAELLGAAWVELGMRHDAELDGMRPSPEGSEEARAAALDAARDRLVDETSPGDLETPTPEPITAGPVGVQVLGALRLSGEPLHAAGGGGLAVDIELFAPLALVLDARAEHGRVEAGALGSVAVTTAWVGALLALRLPFGLDHADFGVGARGGAAILEGRASSGASAETIAGGTLAVISAAHLSLHVVGSAYLHVGVELGWIAVPVRGTLAPTGETLAGIAGALGVLVLGVEIRPQ